MQEMQEIPKVELLEVLEKIVDDLQDWVIIGDCYGRIIYANANVYACCDCTKQTVLGADMCMFVGVDLSDEATLAKINKFVRDGEKFEFLTNRFVKENKRIYLTNTLTAIWNDNKLKYFVCLSKDVTSTQKLKEEVYRAHYFDKLTNLPNQKIFLETVYRQTKKACKNETKFSVILLDIRKIGEINNTYGVTVGDRVIKAVGARIKEHLNKNQEIFKYAGNVFAIIDQNDHNGSDTHNLLHTLAVIMKEPIIIHNSYLYVEFKAGIALYPEDTIKPIELIKMTQIALTKAKKESRYTSYAFYTKGIHEEVQSSMLLETEMKIAVQNDEFIVYYQPLINLTNNSIVGMEALLRQVKCNGEIVLPGKFINVLEEMNLIEKVGIMVIEKVCIQIKRWKDAGYHLVPISINLSAYQFKNPALASNIKGILEKYKVDPKYIILEITESAVMDDVGIAQLIINELKEYGFCIAIDDFGTGYASIGYLKKFMFDHLKIDISFIREIVKNPQDREIVKAIIAIAKTLNLTTIAEGIEDEEQLHIMSLMGCEIGQGFLWDKPISGKDMEAKYLMGI